MNLLHISESASLGLHTMALLARRSEDSLSCRDMAVMLGASAHTLSKVLQRLSKSGLVESLRGPGGGFSLSGDPQKISLLQIFEAIEGPMGKPRCLLSSPVCNGKSCVLGGLVESVQEQVRAYFATTSLERLAATVHMEALKS